MFKDTDEALARLEAELLAEEETEEEYEEYEEYEDYEEEEEDLAPPEYVYEDTRPSAGSVIYQNYANGYNAYNADISDADPDDLSEELLSEEEPSGSAAPAIIACLLALTAAAVFLIFALRSRGVI